jgi:hypothetical protein
VCVVGWRGRDGGVCACALVMGAARKMVVEVTSARGLMPKDGQGSANPYCVVSAGTWMRNVVVFFAFAAGWSDGTFSFSGLRERERSQPCVLTAIDVACSWTMTASGRGRRSRLKIWIQIGMKR